MLSPHYAAASPSGVRPEDPALLFRGSPVGRCAALVAAKSPAELPALAEEACVREVGEGLEGVDCKSFGEFVSFLAQRGDVTESNFCSLFSSDWDTFSTGGHRQRATGTGRRGGSASGQARSTRRRHQRQRPQRPQRRVSGRRWRRWRRLV